MVMQLVTVWIW